MEQVLDLGTLADVTFTVETSLRERDYRSLVNFPLTFSPSAAAREILCPFRRTSNQRLGENGAPYRAKMITMSTL